MSIHTDKLKDLNKEMKEFIFLLNLSIDKKSNIEKIVKDINNLDKDIITFRNELIKLDANLEQLVAEMNECRKELKEYMNTVYSLDTLTCKLSYKDDLKINLERIY